MDKNISVESHMKVYYTYDLQYSIQNRWVSKVSTRSIISILVTLHYHGVQVGLGRTVEESFDLSFFLTNAYARNEMRCMYTKKVSYVYEQSFSFYE